jgi:DNA-binding Xre family transcriptional regulator
MDMSLTGLAGQCGITTSSLEQLIAGQVPVAATGRINTTTSSLQAFVNGGTSIGLASDLGITSSSLQELRNKIGKQGAIGLIIGLMSQRG